jgi:hypothetical protein
MKEQNGVKGGKERKKGNGVKNEYTEETVSR